jgi:hypothetical protein
VGVARHRAGEVSTATDFDLHIGAPGWISVGFAASIVSSVGLAAEGLHLRSSARTCGSNPGANH